MVASNSNKPALRRLLLAKSLWLRGDKLSRNRSSLDGMLALHHLHLSIETTLRAIAIEYKIGQVGSKRDPSFSEWVKLIGKDKTLQEKGISLPLISEIQKINDRRNLTQHHADPVHEDILEEARVFTRRFLEESFASFFDIDLWALDDLMYIEDEKLRELLSIARKHAESGMEDGITFGLAMLDLAFQLAHSSWPKSFGFFPREIEATESVAEEFQGVHRDLALVGTGVDLIRYRYFKAMTPGVTLNMMGSQYYVTVFKNLSDPPEDYRRAEQFVVDTLLTWQEQGLAPKFSVEDSVLQQARDYLAAIETKLQASTEGDDKDQNEAD